MEDKVKRYIQLLFEGIPYSETIHEARISIEAKIIDEYHQLCKEFHPQEAFERMVQLYPNLSTMLELYNPNNDHSIQQYLVENPTLSFQETKALIQKEKRWFWIIGILLMIALLQFNYLAGGFYTYANRLYLIASVVLYGGLCFITLYFAKKIYKKKFGQNNSQLTFDEEAYLYLQKEADSAIKSSINWMAIFIAMVVEFYLLERYGYLYLLSKKEEVISSTLTLSQLLFIPLIFFISKFLFVKQLKRKNQYLISPKYKRYVTIASISYLIYWLIALILLKVFKVGMSFYTTYMTITLVLFGLFVLLTNLLFRKSITKKNIELSKKKILLVLVLCLLFGTFGVLNKDTWYTQPYINSVPVVEHNQNHIDYDEETGIYTITSTTEEFKILHLTDIHLGGSLYSYSKDLKALEACYKLIEYTQPDLVVVTGDLCFPLGIMSLSLNNTCAIHQFVAFMRNIGIPWVFTFGNHDTESIASSSKNQVTEVYKSLSYKTSGTLLYPYIQPDITGRNNQLVEIRNSDGSLNTALFLIDSNAYTGEGINEYDYIHDDQVEWYENEVQRLSKKENKIISSFVFMHIPLQQYRIAYDLYEAGSDEVIYYFGENGETAINKVCCSDYPSSLFDKMVELKSTKGVFCGHDHYNNMSLEYQGIRLTYGMSIDYLAMPGIEDDYKQRGAELITLNKDSSFTLEQIPLDSIK